jgi:hypothetical protein
LQPATRGAVAPGCPLQVLVPRGASLWAFRYHPWLTSPPASAVLFNKLAHLFIDNRPLNCLSCTQNSPLRMIKYTTQFLAKLEDLIAESDYIMRYEKGNFKSGYCLLKEQKIMIVNKFFVTEGKINALLDILKNIELDTTNFSEKNLKLYEELTQAEVKL